MYNFVIGLIVVFSVLLVLFILAQNAKGGGLTSQFGGSAASNVIGVKRTSDLLEKLTWSLLGAIVVLCLSTGFISPTSGGPGNNILDEASEQAAPMNMTPNFNLDTTNSQEADSAQ